MIYLPAFSLEEYVDALVPISDSYCSNVLDAPAQNQLFVSPSQVSDERTEEA